eukprot:SAG31_NODE_9332_length_1295_cov_1.586957_1_plen_186_part_00
MQDRVRVRLVCISAHLHRLDKAEAGARVSLLAATSEQTSPNPDLVVDEDANLGGWMLPAARRRAFHDPAFGYQGISLRAARILTLTPGPHALAAKIARLPEVKLATDNRFFSGMAVLAPGGQLVFEKYGKHDLLGPTLDAQSYVACCSMAADANATVLPCVLQHRILGPTGCTACNLSRRRRCIC